jgi:hypothetical protein
MDIRWDRDPGTAEQKMIADYLAQSADLLSAVLTLTSRHCLLTTSFTPNSFEKRFFTFEIRYDHLSAACHLVVWRGMRTGDAVPLLYGTLDKAEGV